MDKAPICALCLRYPYPTALVWNAFGKQIDDGCVCVS